MMNFEKSIHSREFFQVDYFENYVIPNQKFELEKMESHKDIL